MELKLEGTVIDLSTGQATRDGRVFELTDKERALLRYLVERPRQLVRRAELLTEVWGYHPRSTSRAVDKTLTRLRAKIESNRDAPQFLRTVYGEGVCFHPPFDRAPHNVSLRVDRFFGRHRALEALDTWLDSEGRAVTLTGVGGVGKTRLAQEACRRWLDSGRRTSIWICKLGQASDREDFLGAICRSLDVRYGRSTTVESLVPILRARGQWILVLDDADRVLDAAVDGLAFWLSEVPGLQVLATSRERLGCRGELVIELDGLDREEAGRLLCDRAGWQAPDVDAVQAVVERTEGLPLALELLGAHGAAFPPALLVEQLNWAVSAPVLRDRADRHSTMNSAVLWSWERLDPASRTALSEATVFRDFLPSKGLVEVLTCAEPFRIVASLRARSLLWERDGRLGMYDAVRRLAERHLRDSERRAAQRRHATFCAEEMRRIADDVGRISGYEILLREVGEENVWAAHAYATQEDSALALDLVYGILRLLSQRMPLPDLLALSGRALAQGTEASQVCIAEVRCAHAAVGLIANRSGAREELEAVLEEARATENGRLEGRVLRALTMFPQRGRDMRAQGERAVQLGLETSDVEAAYAWGGLGWVHLRQQEAEDAGRAFRESSRLFRRLGQTVSLAWSESALLHVEDTWDGLQRRVDDLLASGGVDRLPPAVQTNVATILTDALLDLGRYEEAVAWTHRALRLDQRHGTNVRTFGTCSANLGLAALAVGDHSAARRCLEQAVQASPAGGPREGLNRCEIGVVLAMEGDLSGALVQMERGLQGVPPDGWTRRRLTLWCTAVRWALSGVSPSTKVPPDRETDTPAPLDVVISARGAQAYQAVSEALGGSELALSSLRDPQAGSPLAQALQVSLDARLLVDFVVRFAPGR